MRTRNLQFMLSIFSSVILLSSCARDTVNSDQVATQKSPAPTSPSQSPNRDGNSSPSGDGGVQNNNIRRSYSFIYSEGDARSTFIATFYLANTWTTTVKLTPPSQLLVNGNLIQPKELMSKDSAVTAGVFLPLFSPFFFLASGTNYFADLPGLSGNSTINVEWTDQAGQIFRDRMSMEGFSFHSPGYASMSRSFEISVSDGGSNAEYSATLSPKDPALGADSPRRSAVARARGKSIVFSPKDMEKLGVGSAELIVEKRVNVNLDLRGGNRGSGSVVYRATPRRVDVSP